MYVKMSCVREQLMCQSGFYTSEQEYVWVLYFSPLPPHMGLAFHLFRVGFILHPRAVERGSLTSHTIVAPHCTLLCFK